MSSLLRAFSCCSEQGLLFIAVRGLLFIAVCGLLIAVASFVAEQGSRAQASVVVVHKLSCSAACGIFPD